MKHIISNIALALALASTTGGCATDPETLALPDGYEGFMTFFADGSYDPVDANYQPPDGVHFYKEIMGYTDEQLADRESQAIAFFSERFGVDPTAPEYQDRVRMDLMEFDPRANYRVIAAAQEAVPSTGWPVHDGSFSLVITDPDGLDLGGDFAGRHQPAGFLAAFGDYYIDAGDHAIHIEFRSATPFIAGPDGEVFFMCDLESEDYGAGLAEGIARFGQRPDGFVTNDIRNVLMFF